MLVKNSDLRPKPYEVYNFVDEDRIYDVNDGTMKMRLLGYIYDPKSKRQFVIYNVVGQEADGIYIEEKISEKVSDHLYGEDRLVQIEDNYEFFSIKFIAEKEGIIPVTGGANQ